MYLCSPGHLHTSYELLTLTSPSTATDVW